MTLRWPGPRGPGLWGGKLACEDRVSEKLRCCLKPFGHWGRPQRFIAKFRTFSYLLTYYDHTMIVNFSFIHLGQATSRSNIKSQWKLQGLEGFHEVELDLLFADMNWITYSDYSAQKFRIKLQNTAKLIEAMWLLCTVCHHRWHCSCKQLSINQLIPCKSCKPQTWKTQILWRRGTLTSDCNNQSVPLLFVPLVLWRFETLYNAI